MALRGLQGFNPNRAGPATRSTQTEPSRARGSSSEHIKQRLRSGRNVGRRSRPVANEDGCGMCRDDIIESVSVQDL